MVPVVPSVFDMDASVDFLEMLAGQKAVRKGESAIVLVANRVDARTLAAQELESFLAAWDLPVIAHLHAAQVYVHCAANGSSLSDLPRSRAEPESIVSSRSGTGSPGTFDRAIRARHAALPVAQPRTGAVALRCGRVLNCTTGFFASFLPNMIDLR